jgi:hypothetical protein
MLLLLPACTNYEKRPFEVTVRNETARPISVGLVKNGPPVEEGWMAPHDVAIMMPQLTDRNWGLVVKPGETKTLGPHTGLFQPGVQAILRAYGGTPTIEEMVGYPKDDPERVDIYLYPGKSGYVIRDMGGRLEYRRLEESQ